MNRVRLCFSESHQRPSYRSIRGQWDTFPETCAHILTKFLDYSPVGRTETTLQSCIREPAQASALAELRQSISSSLEALNQKVEAVQNVRIAITLSPFTRSNRLDPQLAYTNTQTLQTIRDQQFQILTTIIPLLPMLQKVPLHIASAEANLKEEIRKSAVAPTIASIQPPSADPTPVFRKRKLSRNTEQHSPSPSVTKRRRIRTDSTCTAEEQLPSSKPSLGPSFTRSGLPTADHHRSVTSDLRPGSESASRPNNTARTPNPDQRSSMQPPTPRIVTRTPSRMHSIALSDKPAQPTPSSLSHKKLRASDTSVHPHFTRPVSNTKSVTSAPPNRHNNPTDAFEAPNLFRIHTPLRTGSKQPNDWSTRPSAPVQPSIGFSAVRGRPTRKPFSVLYLPCPPFCTATGETLYPNHRGGRRRRNCR